MYAEQRRYSEKLRQLEIVSETGLGPSEAEFLNLLRERGLNSKLNKSKRRSNQAAVSGR